MDKVKALEEKIQKLKEKRNKLILQLGKRSEKNQKEIEKEKEEESEKTTSQDGYPMQSAKRLLR